MDGQKKNCKNCGALIDVYVYDPVFSANAIVTKQCPVCKGSTGFVDAVEVKKSSFNSKSANSADFSLLFRIFLIISIIFCALYIYLERESVNSYIEKAARYQPVEFKDPNLEMAVREAAGVKLKFIMKKDLEKIRFLDIHEKNISDLEGIQHLVNLEDLQAYNNFINDITGLKGLKKLIMLRIDNNKISDLTPLSELTELKVLKLNNNKISDVKPLSLLEKLTVLYLYENNIKDISSLGKLTKLHIFYASGNEIRDIAIMENFDDMRDLRISENRIRDISPLRNMWHLKSLMISGNFITDISVLSKFYELENLEMARNAISDIGPFSMLEKIKTASFQNNRVRDIAPILKNKYIGEKVTIILTGNPLNNKSKTMLRTLKNRGVKIEYESQ